MARTREPGHATQIAHEFISAQAQGVLAVVGGDGTVHEVIQAMGKLPGRGILAFVPAGGGNDAARTMGSRGQTRSAREGIQAIIDGDERRLDLGDVNGESFFNGVGVGLDGAAAARSKDFAHLRGLPAYLAAALLTVARYKNPRFRLECGGLCREGPGLLCAVGNGPSCGGGFLLTPDAVPDDGQLDACLIGDLGRLESLRNLPRAFSGAHRRHHKVQFFRGRELTLSADRPLFFHADGEVRRMEGALHFSLLPGALRVRVPAGRTPADSGA